MKIFPELRISSHTHSGRDHEFHIINNGESAIIELIKVDPIGSAFLENRTYPFIIDKQGKCMLKFTESGMTHIDDITVNIYYADKAYNRYIVRLNQETLSLPVEVTSNA